MRECHHKSVRMRTKIVRNADRQKEMVLPTLTPLQSSEATAGFSLRGIGRSLQISEATVRQPLCVAAICYPGHARSALAFDSQAQVVAASAGFSHTAPS